MKGRQRSMAIRSGINKQGWQKSDFPVACQKCYGDNPFMRMLKQDYGQQCRVCFRPFTVFKWKGDRGIYKRTCICQSCSKQKNVCQVCSLDLQFGLPMQVRDKRCGKNGKLLLDQNFTNADSKKIKPPPPPGPPPGLKNTGSDKQLVFIPQKQSDQQQNQEQKNEKVDNVGDQKVRRQEQGQQNREARNQQQKQQQKGKHAQSQNENGKQDNKS